MSHNIKTTSSFDQEFDCIVDATGRVGTFVDIPSALAAGHEVLGVMPGTYLITNPIDISSIGAIFNWTGLGTNPSDVIIEYNTDLFTGLINNAYSRYNLGAGAVYDDTNDGYYAFTGEDWTSVVGIGDELIFNSTSNTYCPGYKGHTVSYIDASEVRFDKPVDWCRPGIALANSQSYMTYVNNTNQPENPATLEFRNIQFENVGDSTVQVIDNIDYKSIVNVKSYNCNFYLNGGDFCDYNHGGIEFYDCEVHGRWDDPTYNSIPSDTIYNVSVAENTKFYNCNMDFELYYYHTSPKLNNCEFNNTRFVTKDFLIPTRSDSPESYGDWYVRKENHLGFMTNCKFGRAVLADKTSGSIGTETVTGAALPFLFDFSGSHGTCIFQHSSGSATKHNPYGSMNIQMLDKTGGKNTVSSVGELQCLMTWQVPDIFMKNGTYDFETHLYDLFYLFPYSGLNLEGQGVPSDFDNSFNDGVLFKGRSGRQIFYYSSSVYSNVGVQAGTKGDNFITFDVPRTSYRNHVLVQDQSPWATYRATEDTSASATIEVDDLLVDDLVGTETFDIYRYPIMDVSFKNFAIQSQTGSSQVYLTGCINLSFDNIQMGRSDGVAGQTGLNLVACIDVKCKNIKTGYTGSAVLLQKSKQFEISNIGKSFQGNVTSGEGVKTVSASNGTIKNVKNGYINFGQSNNITVEGLSTVTGGIILNKCYNIKVTNSVMEDVGGNDTISNINFDNCEFTGLYPLRNNIRMEESVFDGCIFPNSSGYDILFQPNTSGSNKMIFRDCQDSIVNLATNVQASINLGQSPQVETILWYVLNNSEGNVHLAHAGVSKGKTITIKHAKGDLGAPSQYIQINPLATDLIDGVNSPYIINTNYESITLVSNGVDGWNII